MSSQGMHLRDLVRALGWDYAALWSTSNLNTELVWADGSFELHPFKRYEQDNWSVERLFSSAYKTCSFPMGSGYAGKVLQEGQPLWLNRNEDLIRHSNTSSQAHFFQVAAIQTLLCIPWYNSVVELGSSSFLTQDPDLLIQIRSFLSHMATSQQQMKRVYFPIESSFVSQDHSPAGSDDDTSFNSGLNRDQQSCSSFPDISRTVQRRATAAEEHDFTAEVVAGSGESDWRLEFATSQILQKNLISPRSTLTPQRQQEEVELVEETDFASSFLICPRQQMPLLSQLEYNQTVSTSNSSSRGDDTNNVFSGSDGNSEEQSGNDNYFPRNRNSNVSRQSTVAAGFRPWNDTGRSSFETGAEQNSSHSNQVVLRKCMNMAHKIHHLKSSRGKQSVPEPNTIAPGSHVPTPEEVLSGHDEAAVNHMMAERKRRQKQKENFSVLKELIPCVSKLDRASILGDAINYVKQLQHRVEELESLNRELEGQIPALQRKRSRSSV